MTGWAGVQDGPGSSSIVLHSYIFTLSKPPSMSTIPPGHKRVYSNSAEVPRLKRPQKAPPSTTEASAVQGTSKPSFDHIYVVTTEEWLHPREDSTKEIIGAYVSLQDANWKAIYLRREEDEDVGGRIILLDASVFAITVQCMKLSWPGSEKEPEELSEEADEDEDDESDEGSSGPEDPYADIKAAQQGRRPRNMCRGSGCGAPLCDSCWPRTEEERKDC